LETNWEIFGLELQTFKTKPAELLLLVPFRRIGALHVFAEAVFLSFDG